MENYKVWKKERDEWLKNADDETKEQIEVFMGLDPESFGIEIFPSENVHYELCVNVVFEFQKKLSKEDMKTCVETVRKENEIRTIKNNSLKKLKEERIEREKIREVVEEVLREKETIEKDLFFSFFTYIFERAGVLAFICFVAFVIYRLVMGI